MPSKKNKVVMLFSDLHIPYQHPDAIKFLKAVKKKYNPTTVICAGDLIDNHAISFHDSDPDLSAAGDETVKTKTILQKVISIFPKLAVALGNHDLLMLRKFKKNGLPSIWLKSFHQVLNLPKEWSFHDDLIVSLPNKDKLFVTHGKQKNTLKLAQEMGLNSAQGHYHTQFGVNYASSPDKLMYGIDIGCLVDRRSLAMAYLTSVKRPILGCIIIKGNTVIPVPMVINKKHRWNGEVE